MKALPPPTHPIFTFACVVGIIATPGLIWLTTWATLELHRYFHP